MDNPSPATNFEPAAPAAPAPRLYGEPSISPEIAQLAEALAKAQGEMSAAAKDSNNPHFGSKYASLASVIEAIRAPFAKHGLSITQLPVMGDARVVCRTRLMHDSGQWIQADFPCMLGENKNPMQALGSAWTYARKYSLMAMVGVAPDDEDDGNAVGNVPPRQQPRQQPRQRAQGQAEPKQAPQQAQAPAQPQQAAAPAKPDPNLKALQDALGAAVQDARDAQDIDSLQAVIATHAHKVQEAEAKLPKTAARVKEVYQERLAQLKQAAEEGVNPDTGEVDDSIYGNEQAPGGKLP